MGSDTASLELINAMEAIRTVQGIIGVMFYDFTRAFDSVSNSSVDLPCYGLASAHDWQTT